MRRSLTSSRTFFYKFVFPLVWIGLFGIGTTFAWQQPSGTHPPPPQFKWMMTAGWLAGTAFVFWFARSLKRVEVDDTTLYLSSYREEIAVPLSDVARVHKRLLLNPPTIVITFSRETAFGRTVSFLPPVSFRLFQDDPTLVGLNALVRRNRRDA